MSGRSILSLIFQKQANAFLLNRALETDWLLEERFLKEKAGSVPFLLPPRCMISFGFNLRVHVCVILILSGILLLMSCVVESHCELLWVLYWGGKWDVKQTSQQSEAWMSLA